MNMTKHNIRNPYIIDLETAVGTAFLDDPMFLEQVMMEPGDESFNPNEFEEVFPDMSMFDNNILDDLVCGDSLDMMDIEADEFIDSANNIMDSDDEIIDMVLGLPAM